VALLENGRMAEIFIERSDHKQIVGNIYQGRVESVVPGIQAAFVDIGMHKNGFLYVSDVVDTQAYFDDVEIERVESNDKKLPRGRDANIDDVLKEGQEILVQVTKEPIGTKGPRLTSFITLPGRFLVMMPTVSHLGISRKIPSDKERDRLKKVITRVRPRGSGYIVRTAAEGKGEMERLELGVFHLVFRDDASGNQDAVQASFLIDVLLLPLRRGDFSCHKRSSFPFRKI